jgi:hypothetical protein
MSLILNRATTVRLSFVQRLRLLFGANLTIVGSVASCTNAVAASLTIAAQINGRQVASAGQECDPARWQSAPVLPVPQDPERSDGTSSPSNITKGSTP